MKANKFFLGLALIGAILTGCNNDQSVTGPTGELSYISVNLNYANQGTRAGEVFENGIDAENAIKDVTFFFFDASKNAYTVNTNDFSEAGTGISANSITVTKEQLGEMNPQTNGNPVEEISNAVLVIERNKVTPPSYMLAVVNCPDSLKTAGLDLDQFQAKVGAYNTITDGTTNYFVMANSVYVNGAGEAMYLTPITNDNLASTAEEAKQTGKPVEIYVERTAAKVRVNNFVEGNQTGLRFPVKTSTGANYQTVGADGKTLVDVYAEIIGWHVTDINNEAYLLKNINAAWTDETTGISGWNDILRYRSYWATSEDATSNRHPHTGNAIAAHKAPFDYYYENTNNENEGANRSQLVVLAKFFAGSTAVESTDIAEWWGVKYTIEGLRTAIANSLASELYIKGNDNKYTSITPEYIAFQQVTNSSTTETGLEAGRYWSNAVLATDKATTTFYNAQGTALTSEEVTAIFAGVRHAKIWSKTLGGYYYLDIAHVGTKTPGNFGMVRNHLYEYTINNIVGLGTPVFDGNQIIVPEKPDEEETYISAKLNIQAWRVVSQNQVTLQ